MSKASEIYIIILTAYAVFVSLAFLVVLWKVMWLQVKICMLENDLKLAKYSYAQIFDDTKDTNS